MSMLITMRVLIWRCALAACSFAHSFASISRREGFARVHVAYSQADVDAFVKQIGTSQHRAPKEAPGSAPQALPGAFSRPPYAPLGLVAQNAASPLVSSGSHDALTPLAAAVATAAASPAAAVTPPLQLTPAAAIAEASPVWMQASTPAAEASTPNTLLPPGAPCVLMQILPVGTALPAKPQDLVPCSQAADA
jgi:hypothetical protein